MALKMFFLLSVVCLSAGFVFGIDDEEPTTTEDDVPTTTDAAALADVTDATEEDNATTAEEPDTTVDVDNDELQQDQSKDEPCVDKLPDKCPHWASQRHCSKSALLMRQECPHSCGLCGDTCNSTRVSYDVIYYQKGTEPTELLNKATWVECCVACEQLPSCTGWNWLPGAVCELNGCNAFGDGLAKQMPMQNAVSGNVDEHAKRCTKD